MPKEKKVQGAKLNEIQKLQLKKEILIAFPNVKMFEEEIDFLIEEYSERNKNIAKEITEKGEQWLKDRGHEIEEVKGGEIRNFAPGDKEYEDVIAKFEKAKVDEEKRMKEIELKALEEMAQKNKSIDNIKNVKTSTI